MALLIQRKDLRPLLSDIGFLGRVINAIEQVLSEHQRGEALNYAYLHMPLSERGHLSVLPAISPTVGACLRISPAFGGSSTRQTDSRLIVLLDGKNGQLLAILADNDLNVIRTGAPAAVACRYLAPPNSKVVALLGSGRQARGQLLAIQQAVPSLERVLVYSPTPEHREAFAEEMRSQLSLSVQAVTNPKHAVEGADIIDLATSAGKPVLEAGWPSPGTLVISIAPRQVPTALALRGPLIVSSRTRMLEEKREPYASMAKAGQWSYDRMIELGEVIVGRARPRENQLDDVILCELTGMPLWDAAIAKLAYSWALENKVGTTFHLSAE